MAWSFAYAALIFCVLGLPKNSRTLSALVVSSGNAAKLLDTAEETFNEVTGIIVVWLRLSPSMNRFISAPLPMITHQ